MTWWNDYVGIKFVDGGRQRSGCDCAGLVCLVYREQLKIDVDENLGFYDALDPQQASALFDQVVKMDDWLQVDEPADFDVVRLRMNGQACHVGVIVDGARSVLNVRRGCNAVIEPLEAWRQHIDSYWRRTV